MVALNLTWLPPVTTASGTTWSMTQTIPIKFSLRDDDGVFGVDPGVIVRLSDAADTSGTRSSIFRIGQGSDSLRICEDDELYILNVKPRSLGWASPGTLIRVTVEAGGVVLGAFEAPVR